MPNKKTITKDVLAVIAAGSLIAGSAVAPGLPVLAGLVMKVLKDANRAEVGRIIKRLQKQEMISVNEKDGKIILGVTEKGRKRLLEYDFENMQLKAKRRDGKWRLIFFDIPEYKKSERDMFRKKLTQLGFIRLQDSCFVSAFPCKDEVDFLCHFFEISDYVSLISVNKIERGEELLFKKFQTPGLDDE